jgi:hypothetical protein
VLSPSREANSRTDSGYQEKSPSAILWSNTATERNNITMNHATSGTVHRAIRRAGIGSR